MCDRAPRRDPRRGPKIEESMTEPSPKRRGERDAVDPGGGPAPAPSRRSHDDPGDDRANPFNPFALVVLLVLVVGGLWLVFRLRDMAAVQDCAWSGRRNCAPIEPQAPVPLSK
jgi:hypothetical protein